MQVFVAYENGKPVWFDDLRISHQPALIVQENHYYPFGMNITSLEKSGQPKNKFQFQGQEKQDEFGLNWSSFKWRNADVQLGRFFSVDPLAEEYVYNSPYAFSENQVVAHVELEGLEKVFAMKGINHNKKFKKAYNVQRRTSGGKRFTNKLKNQSRYNVLYFASAGIIDGITTVVSSEKQVNRLKKNHPETFELLTVEGVVTAQHGDKDKEVILIGIDIDDINAEEPNDAASILNHEEFHAESTLDGNAGKGKNEDDHGRYFGVKTYETPDDEEVRTNPKYANTEAYKQIKEIDKIIEEDKKKKEK